MDGLKMCAEYDIDIDEILDHLICDGPWPPAIVRWDVSRIAPPETGRRRRICGRF